MDPPARARVRAAGATCSATKARRSGSDMPPCARGSAPPTAAARRRRSTTGSASGSASTALRGLVEWFYDQELSRTRVAELARRRRGGRDRRRPLGRGAPRPGGRASRARGARGGHAARVPGRVSARSLRRRVPRLSVASCRGSRRASTCRRPASPGSRSTRRAARCASRSSCSPSRKVLRPERPKSRPASARAGAASDARRRRAPGVPPPDRPFRPRPRPPPADRQRRRPRPHRPASTTASSKRTRRGLVTSATLMVGYRRRRRRRGRAWPTTRSSASGSTSRSPAPADAARVPRPEPGRRRGGLPRKPEHLASFEPGEVLAEIAQPGRAVPRSHRAAVRPISTATTTRIAIPIVLDAPSSSVARHQLPVRALVGCCRRRLHDARLSATSTLCRGLFRRRGDAGASLEDRGAVAGGTSELMCHPGYSRRRAPAGQQLRRPARGRDPSALRSWPLAAGRAPGIELVTFGAPGTR